jgi:hypothetical protein
MNKSSNISDSNKIIGFEATKGVGRCEIFMCVAGLTAALACLHTSHPTETTHAFQRSVRRLPLQGVCLARSRCSVEGTHSVKFGAMLINTGHAAGFRLPDAFTCWCVLVYGLA